MIARRRADTNSTVERIDGVSIRLRDGRIFTHDTHYDALSDAFAIGAFPEFSASSESSTEDFTEAVQTGDLCKRYDIKSGFVTTTGRFVNREEGHRIALLSMQINSSERLSEGDVLYAESLIPSTT